MQTILRATTLFFLLVSFYSGFAQASKVKIQPRKDWVTPVSFDATAKPASNQNGGSYYLLIDDQENVAIQENYIHTVYQVLTHEAIQEMSDISISFDPSYQELIFHQVMIHRNGNPINQLSKDKIRTIQREESMERFLYDGSLTAVINLTDVRAGDIIEYSFTRKGYNPVNKGHFSSTVTIDYTIPYEKMFSKIIVPQGRVLQIKSYNTDSEPEIKQEGKSTSYTWVFNKVTGYMYDNNEPAWYTSTRHILVSDFNSWSEVARWATEEFKLTQAEKKAIQEEVDSKFQTSNLDTFTLEAIRFVQDEIRYLGFEGGLNSHKPHSPIKVFNQRFGDCKDKSLLLSAMLQAKGIPSYPVLVSTEWRDKISEKLPSQSAFNHCVVQLELNGETIYIDPTINNQGGPILKNYFPPYGKGLVIHESTQDLVVFSESEQPTTSEVQTFEVASIGAEAVLSVRTTYTGADADSQRSYFSNNTLDAIQKGYLTYYGNLYPDIQKLEDIITQDNRRDNIFTVEEKYTIQTFWKPQAELEGQIFCELYAQSLESHFNISKSSLRTAPYSISYPVDYHHHIHVKLPEEWTILPTEKKLEGPSYLYERDIRYRDREVSLYTHYKTKKSYVAVDDFQKFVDDHQQMMSDLGYSLTYNKGIESGPRGPWALLYIITIIGGGWLMIWLYQNFDPRPYFDDIKAEPIGGWLVLAAIGLAISPFRLFHDIISNPDVMSSSSLTGLLLTKSYGLFMFILFTQVYTIVNLFFSILLVVLFYMRRSSLPRLITIFIVANCITVVADSLISYQIAKETFRGREVYMNIIPSIISAAIWIPYFTISSRVKQTFVNRRIR